jgi:hypothetical protein
MQPGISFPVTLPVLFSSACKGTQEVAENGRNATFKTMRFTDAGWRICATAQVAVDHHQSAAAGRHAQAVLASKRPSSGGPSILEHGPLPWPPQSSACHRITDGRMQQSA